MEENRAISQTGEMNELFGEHPAAKAKPETKIADDIRERISAWAKSGISTKEEREAIMATVPNLAKCNLAAPELNEEIAIDLHPRAIAKDNHFKLYQNLAGATLSCMTLLSIQFLRKARNTQHERAHCKHWQQR